MRYIWFLILLLCCFTVAAEVEVHYFESAHEAIDKIDELIDVSEPVVPSYKYGYSQKYVDDRLKLFPGGGYYRDTGRDRQRSYRSKGEPAWHYQDRKYDTFLEYDDYYYREDKTEKWNHRAYEKYWDKYHSDDFGEIDDDIAQFRRSDPERTYGREYYLGRATGERVAYFDENFNYFYKYGDDLPERYEYKNRIYQKIQR